MSTIPHAREVDPSAVRESSGTTPWRQTVFFWALGGAVTLISMALFGSAWLYVTLGVGVVCTGIYFTWPHIRKRH
ncbi:MAG: hypothetical protein HGA44_10810 [Cellulomonadaceae bacterium]|nr:hypothetical protein [Cellulomonadaceae bacterium]